MLVESELLQSAYHVEPGNTLYTTVLTLKHKTLAVGDVVKLVDRPIGNLFIRVADLTLHCPYVGDQYVIVTPVPAPKP